MVARQRLAPLQQRGKCVSPQQAFEQIWFKPKEPLMTITLSPPGFPRDQRQEREEAPPWCEKSPRQNRRENVRKRKHYLMWIMLYKVN